MAKSPDAFRSIGEVSRLVGVAPHVLRYWEQQFAQLAPVKRADGRRYYRPEDVCLAAGLSQVLREEGLSIRGARRLIAADRGAGLRQVGAARLARAAGFDGGAGAGDIAGVAPPGGPELPAAIRLAVAAPADVGRAIASGPKAAGSGSEAGVAAPSPPSPEAPAPAGALSPPRPQGEEQLPLFARGADEWPGGPASDADPWLLRLNALARKLEVVALEAGAPRGAGAISTRLRSLLGRGTA